MHPSVNSFLLRLRFDFILPRARATSSCIIIIIINNNNIIIIIQLFRDNFICLAFILFPILQRCWHFVEDMTATLNRYFNFHFFF